MELSTNGAQCGDVKKLKYDSCEIDIPWQCDKRYCFWHRINIGRYIMGNANHEWNRRQGSKLIPSHIIKSSIFLQNNPSTIKKNK